ncbi:MAG TPA: ankyrin repeat domain-containing protein, partial [Nitrospirota bacterium]
MSNKIVLTVLFVVAFLSAPSHPLKAETEPDPDIDIRMRFSIVEGNAESVKKFLEQGANANATYTDGVTPLADAVTRSRSPIDVVKVLLQHGADPKIKSNGASPLSLAIKLGNDELISILHEYAESDAELYDIAVYFLNKGNESSALEYADEALKLNPANVSAWALRGSVFLSPNYRNIRYAETAYHKAFEASLGGLKANRSAGGYRTVVWYGLLSSDFAAAL